MGLLDRLLNRNRVNQPLTNSYEDSVASQLQHKTGARATSNGRSLAISYSDDQVKELYQGYVFGAIRKIAGKVAMVITERAETAEQNGKQWEVNDKVEHPYLTAVDNSPMDTVLFWQGIATYYVVLGEAFVFTGERKMVAGNSKPVGAFELLQSNAVKRKWNTEGELTGYVRKWQKPGMLLEKETDYLPDNIISVTDLNPWDLDKGYGMIRPILDKIALESQATKLQSATIGNTIKAPGIVATDEELPAALFEELDEKIKTRWTSSDMDTAGTPIVSNGGKVTWTAISQDWEKLAMKSIREMNRDSFFAALGVSKTILGIEQSGTTRETSRVQTEQFVLDIVMPIANGIINAFNQDFINQYPLDYNRKKLKIIATAPIEKDLEQEKAEAEVSKIKADTFKVYVDAQVEPTQAAELAGIEVEGLKMLEAPVEKVAEPAENAVTVHNHVHVEQEPFQIPEAVTNALSKTQQARLKRAEKQLTKDVTLLNGAFGETYLRPTNAPTGEEVEAYTTALANALITYYNVSVPYYGGERAAQLALQYAGSTTFTMDTKVTADIESRLAKVAHGHYKTIDKELTQAISKGASEGLTRKQVLAEVRGLVESRVKTWQVKRLVDTEVANAYKQSTYYSDLKFITENGYTGKAYKVWRTNSAKPCPFCANAAGTKVPFHQDFYKVGDTMEAEENGKQVYLKVGFVDMNVPSSHANCRCEYQLIIED